MDAIKFLWNKLKTHIIYILIICILTCVLAGSINRCSNVSGEYENNIAALNDTIKYYQDKNGNLVATKLAFESDVKTLKLLNEKLYNQIDSMKLNPKTVTQLVYVGGEIENPQQDTAYVVQHDTISRGFNKTFEFNNEYRTLEGAVDYHNDSLGVAINKDIVRFDYTVAMDKNNHIYVKSTNPYVKYNEISGFTVPKQKKKHWFVGPALNAGYDPINRQWSINAGISIGFGAIQW